MRRARHVFADVVAPTLIALALLALLGARASSAQVRPEDERSGGLGELVAEIAGPGDAAHVVSAGESPGRIHSLVLRRTEWDVEVVGPLASLVLEQEFANDTDLVLEAAYRFPLPPGAAVALFEMEVGDRLLTGLVREKAEARAEFEAARAEGRRASLLEQHRPDVFQARVTNLAPGDVVVVRLVVALQARLEEGWFRLRLPLTVGERHGPAPSSPTHAPVVAAPPRGEAARQGRVARVVVSFPPELTPSEAWSPTHALDRVVDDQGWLQLRWPPRQRALPADRDFVLTWRYDLARGAVAVSPSVDGWREALLFVTPPEDQVAAAKSLPRSKELLVVLDSSGSMGDGSLEAARRALQSVIATLGVDDTFDLIDYDHEFDRLFGLPRHADGATVVEALEWLDAVRADGGTNLLPALVDALHTPREDARHRTIVVLTDGFLGADEDVLAAVRDGLGEARLHVVAIGSAPNAHLAREMAKLGRGTVTFLSPGESVEAGTERLLRRLEAPVLSDVDVTWPGAVVEDVHPDPVPDLPAGVPVALLARLRDGDPIRARVTGEGPLGVRSFDVAAGPDDVLEHPVVSILWARAAIEELETELRLLRGGAFGLDARARTERLAEVRRQLVGLSLRHQIVSSETSFVVVETRRSVRPGGPDATHDAPAEAPAAWPQTGTRHPLRLAAGLLLLAAGLASWLVGRGARPRGSRLARTGAGA